MRYPLFFPPRPTVRPKRLGGCWVGQRAGLHPQMESPGLDSPCLGRDEAERGAALWAATQSAVQCWKCFGRVGRNHWSWVSFKDVLLSIPRVHSQMGLWSLVSSVSFKLSIPRSEWDYDLNWLDRIFFGGSVESTNQDSSLNWKTSDIFADVVAVPSLDLSGEKQKSGEKAKEQATATPVHYPASQVSIVVLKMPALFKLSEDFQSKVQSLMDDFRQIASIWNDAISQQTGVERVERAEGVEVDADGDDDHPGGCPLQAIKVASGPFEMGPFVLGRATCVAMNGLSEMERLLKGQLPARKSLKHLWDSVVRARREHHWGTMHKSCPFLYAEGSGMAPMEEGHYPIDDAIWNGFCQKWLTQVWELYGIMVIWRNLQQFTQMGVRSREHAGNDNDPRAEIPVEAHMSHLELEWFEAKTSLIHPVSSWSQIDRRQIDHVQLVIRSVGSIIPL